MNKIYNQGLGRSKDEDNVCVGVTVANLWEQEKGKAIPLDSIYSWYDKMGFAYDSKKLAPNGKGGNNAPTAEKVLNALTFESMHGIRIKSAEPIWEWKNHKAPPLMVLWNKCKQGRFLFVIRTGCKLDETSTLIPPTQKKLNTHAVALAGVSEETKRFIFENSKGVNWGEKGYGRIKLLDLPQIVTSIWRIEF